VREHGLAARSDVPALRVYGSEHAHSSIDKAVILLGLGHRALRKIPADAQFRMRADLLAAAIAEDRGAGLLPIAVVATVGTTSTTSVDPVPAIAEICSREQLWLHVDAAYAGAAAMVPGFERTLEGCDRADSLVVNPHKWLFTPFDLSAFYSQRMDMVRAAFSLTPEYLRTAETAQVRNLMDTGVQLGRRFRALKLWMILRHFGAEGLRARIAEHIRLAHLFAGWVDADPNFERLAPVPFSVVCFRAKPSGASLSEPELERLNAALLDAVNASGEVFLSHTKLGGRFVIRLAIGHIRTEERHVRRAWEILKRNLRI
jgi:aromatic-L-amino-acid decarboxylase